MPKYEACPCGNPKNENQKWCVCVNGSPDHALGLFDIKAEAEAKAREMNDREMPLEDSVIQPIQTPQEFLRTKVLSVSPHAEFVIPDSSDNHRLYTGQVAASLDTSEGFGIGFAQHIGRGIYALHLVSAPKLKHHDDVIEVKYRNGQIVFTIPERQQGKGRND